MHLQTPPANVDHFVQYPTVPITVAMGIGFDDSVTSATDAINKHSSHPSVLKIEGNRNTEHSISFQLVDTQQVSLALKKVNPRKATGYDNLPGKIIRIAYSELSYPFTHLINMSISLKSFPCTMKCAEISPLLKKDDNLIRDNYSPVNVLTFIRIVILAYFKSCIIYLVLWILQITFYSSKLFFALFKYRVDYFISWCIIIMLCSFCLYILLHVLFLHCIYFAPLCRILAYWLM